MKSKKKVGPKPMTMAEYEKSSMDKKMDKKMLGKVNEKRGMKGNGKGKSKKGK